LIQCCTFYEKEKEKDGTHEANSEEPEGWISDTCGREDRGKYTSGCCEGTECSQGGENQFAISHVST
jgi:hypothetical protein